jgi:hypothetical protein
VSWVADDLPSFFELADFAVLLTRVRAGVPDLVVHAIVGSRESDALQGYAAFAETSAVFATADVTEGDVLQIDGVARYRVRRALPVNDGLELLAWLEPLEA